MCDRLGDEQLQQRRDAARASPVELDALLDHQAHGMIALDAAQNVLFATAPAVRLLGSQPQPGTPFANLLEAFGVEHEASVHGALERGIELPLGNAWIWIRRSALQDGGRIAAAVALVDVTPLRRALDERMESLRFMSHDLRSPQNSILALTQLHEHDPQAFDACGGLPRIAELARYALTLGDQFIFSSVEDGLEQRNLERFDLRAAVRSLIPQLDVSAVYRNVPLRLWLPDGPAVWVKGVRMFVMRALQNLIDNAIRASKAGTSVVVTLKLSGGDAVITIADEAGGLPGLTRERPMDSFDALSRNASGGFGLGLKLAERIVRLHGGTLHAEVNGHLGTLFVLRLPCLGGLRLADGAQPALDNQPEFAAFARQAASPESPYPK